MSKLRDKKQERKLYRWLMNQKALSSQWALVTTGLGVINGILIFFQAMLIAKIIHSVIIDGVVLSQKVWLLLPLLVIFCARAGVLWLMEQASFETGSSIRQLIRYELLEKISESAGIYEVLARSGQWNTAVVELTEQLQMFYARYLPQMTIAVVIPLLYAIFILPLSWMVSLIFILTAPLIPTFMAMLGSRTATVSRRYFDELSRLSAYFLDRLQGLPTLRWFYCSKQEHLRLAAVNENYRLKTLHVLRLAFLSSTVLEFFAAISIALTAVYIGMSHLGYISLGVPENNYSLFVGLFLLMLAPEFYQPLKDLGRYYHARSEAIGAAEGLVKLLDAKKKISLSSKAACPSKVAMFLEFKDVTVCAPLTNTKLLKNISFKLDKEERCLLVGESGSGKTTLLMTLLGMLEYSGEIWVNGQLLEQWQPGSVWNQVAWLGQTPYLLYGSVLENIAIGLGNIPKIQIIQVLKTAGAWSFVSQLPYGVHTCIGENGAELSVGQNQRIALARALIRKAQLILLDEPTASLDFESANYVRNGIEGYSQSKTMIAATHDLRLSSQCDFVLVLSNGELVEQGDKQELLKRKGFFHKQWKLYESIA